MRHEKYDPPGFEFLAHPAGFDAFGVTPYRADGLIRLKLVEDRHSGYDGWLTYHHPDGQWVTLRKATPADLDAINRIRHPLTRVELVACPHCGAVQEARVTAFDKLDGSPADFYAAACVGCGETVNETEWKRDAAPAAAAGA